jgi:hypothetical protein
MHNAQEESRDSHIAILPAHSAVRDRRWFSFSDSLGTSLPWVWQSSVPQDRFPLQYPEAASENERLQGSCSRHSDDASMGD